MTEITYGPENKNSYIITFKKKDQRKNKDVDKSEILQQSVGPKLNFVQVDKLEPGFVAKSDDDGVFAFDINEYQLPVVTAYLDAKEAEQIKKDPNIEAIEEDGLAYAQDLSFVEMAPFDSGATLIPPSATAGSPSVQAETIPWGISRVRAPQCWEASMGRGIYVAVLDTGIYPHVDLRGNLIGGISFVPGQSWVDTNGHGTHVAGTIAARRNSTGVAGVAPSTYLYAIKVLSNSGSGQWSWLMNALYWMRKYHGCTFDVANLSMGGPSAPSALRSFVQYAAQKTLLVCAAGNNAGPVIYPAKYPESVAVSAIKSDNTIASFSSRGNEVFLCAPGVNIYSTLPNNSYGYLSGTSMAAPHVSGVAALCRATHRHHDIDAIKALLRKHADDLGNNGRDPLYGFGRADALGSTFDKKCG